MTKKIKPIKAWAVMFSRKNPYNPAEWFGAFSIFRKKSDAIYWSNTRVHLSNRKAIVPCLITPLTPKRRKR